MKIGAYIVKRQSKQNYAKESYNVRAWPGFEMVLHTARAEGWQIEYVGEATAYKCDVVLVSITSDCDWWPFITERMKWQNSDVRVIAGGPGVLNVRPLLTMVDVFVFGRGEGLILDLLAAEAKAERLESESVCYSDTFSIDNIYRIKQTDSFYSQEFQLANGRMYHETSLGCPNRCFFCGYTWHRKYIGDGRYHGGSDLISVGQSYKERTIRELVEMPLKHWEAEGRIRLVGLDGTSERLRRKANKVIPREMWREFLEKVATFQVPQQLKVYNIIGYPDETEEDWHEFLEDIRLVDDRLQASRQWSLLCHFTPFRAMPATPCATWPMSYCNYRGAIARSLKLEGMPGNVFFQGNQFWAVESMGTDSLATVIQSAIILRGLEYDTEGIQALARTKKYWAASVASRVATLEQWFDCASLFKEYEWNQLPTRYLHSHANVITAS